MIAIVEVEITTDTLVSFVDRVVYGADAESGRENRDLMSRRSPVSYDVPAEQFVATEMMRWIHVRDDEDACQATRPRDQIRRLRHRSVRRPARSRRPNPSPRPTSGRRRRLWIDARSRWWH